MKKGISLFLAMACLIASLQVLAAAGKVIVATGQVTGQVSGKSVRTLKRRSHVFEKDTIKTGPKGYAQLGLKDGTLITLEPNTEYRIDEYRYEKKQAGAASHIATITKGAATTLTGSIKKRRPRNVRINTKMAVIGLRGTQVRIRYQKEGMIVDVRDGYAEIDNRSGKYFVGTGFEANRVLIASERSVPTSVAISEATTAFNAEGVENIASQSINEAISGEQFQLVDAELEAFGTTLQLVEEGLSMEFLMDVVNIFRKSIRVDPWTTAQQSVAKSIVDKNIIIQSLRNKGQSSGEFLNWRGEIALPATSLFLLWGRSTNVANGRPTQYSQNDSVDPVADIFFPTAYIDDPLAPGIFIDVIGDANLEASGSITGLSGSSINWGFWNNTTGPWHCYLIESGVVIDPPCDPFLQDRGLVWIDFIPSSLASLRAVRCVRHYDQTIDVFGKAFYGQMINDGANPPDLPSEPVVQLTSRFRLNYGTIGLGVAQGEGSIDILTADGSKWHFTINPDVSFLQGNSIYFEDVGIISGKLDRPDGEPFGGDITKQIIGNVFSAHSRVYGPYAPAAGFAAAFVAFRATPTGGRLPNEATMTGIFVLKTR